MSKDKLTPELRFPEFKNEGDWGEKVFEEVFDRLTTKNDEDNQNVLTISAQLGLVSQLEFFNKKVSAANVSGYYLLHKGDFAYNKSYSKGYPMGAIKPLKYYDKGVVSTLYICFRAKDGYNGSFFEQYFNAGLLNSEIGNIAQEGGRAHGLLNVSVKEFFKDLNLLVPKPQEQQKIASCLSSLDELISAHNDKLDALKDHKKGLMQNLFPKEGETVPKLRFSEFEGDDEWVEKTIGQVFESFSGGTPKSTEEKYYGGSIPFIRSAEIAKDSTELFLTKEGFKDSSAKLVKKGDVLVALYGANSGDVAISKIDGAINQAILCLRSAFSNSFTHQYLSYKKEWIVSRYIQGGQGNLSGEIIKSVELLFPEKQEQQKIASCLSAVDELITAQADKIEQLQQHKKGMMQGLFPKIES